MLSKISVKKPYTVLVSVVLAIVLGVVSFTKMSTDLLPSISLPYVIVMTLIREPARKRWRWWLPNR